MTRAPLFVFALLVAFARPAAARPDLPGEGYKNHLVIGIGVGVDAIHPSDYDAYTNAFNETHLGPAGRANPSVALHASLAVTYYGPYYILVRTGIEPDYFFPSEQLGGTSVTNYGGTLEVPLLIGGHYALLDDRLVVELAIGPCVSAFTSAGLNDANGSFPDANQLFADPSFGFDSEIKAQYFLTPGFSLGIELGYRILSSSALHQSGATSPYEPYGKPIYLDLSGFRALFELGFAAM